jgi:hypothetical protein
MPSVVDAVTTAWRRVHSGSKLTLIPRHAWFFPHLRMGSIASGGRSKCQAGAGEAKEQSFPDWLGYLGVILWELREFKEHRIRIGAFWSPPSSCRKTRRSTEAHLSVNSGKTRMTGPSHRELIGLLHCSGCQFGAMSVHQDGHEKVPPFTRKLS